MCWRLAPEVGCTPDSSPAALRPGGQLRATSRSQLQTNPLSTGPVFPQCGSAYSNSVAPNDVDSIGKRLAPFYLPTEIGSLINSRVDPEAGNMRCNGHLRMTPQGRRSRKRFTLEDVQAGTRQLTVIERAKQIPFIQMCSPADIHEVGAALHLFKGRRIQYAARLGCQGKRGDDIVSVGDCIRKL